ncbi:MAG: FAD-dependent monooxygenase [Alphaproteobacteria bacterium]|nr:MAG: FAD-dependent monooxygenase [Alphaproteobacteria bacterium]
MPQNRKPVLIAGAGPVGCTAALLLAQHDIPVVLMEALDELPMDLRASTFHPPTLDMLDALGVTPQLISQGLIVPTFQYRDRRTGEFAEFDLDLLRDETRHPYRLQCEQYKFTRVVVDMLKALPHADVRFNHRVVGFSQDGEGVTALAWTPDGEIKIRGCFLIGAEGADSKVRQSAAVLYEGLTYPERFLVMSTKFPFEDHIENLSDVSYMSDPEEWCVLLRTVDLWRFLVPTDPQDSPEKVLSEDYVQDCLQRVCKKDGPYKVEHQLLYNVHQRVAETYRIGRRVLLAGDAAHINNPLGGMGMNGGIHDAINLAEKLVTIINEGGDMDALLDLYNRQRRLICIDFVQSQTAKNKEMIEATDAKTQRRRQQDYMRTANDPELAKAFLMRSSMIEPLRESYEIQ